MAYKIAIVYLVVSAGKLPGSAQANAKHLAGSRLAGSPCQVQGWKAKLMRAWVVPGYGPSRPAR
jgi:hypothetical protein